MLHRHHIAREAFPEATDPTFDSLPSITTTSSNVAATATPTTDSSASPSQSVVLLGHSFSQPFFMLLVLSAIVFMLMLLTCAGFFFRKFTKQRIATDEIGHLKHGLYNDTMESVDRPDILPPEKAALDPPAYRPGTALSSNNPSHFSHGLASQPIFSCIMDFSPSQDDELQLHVGDRVRILEYFDDGWCMGERVDGKIPRGVFPRNVISDRPVTVSPPPRENSPLNPETAKQPPQTPPPAISSAPKTETRHIF